MSRAFATSAAVSPRLGRRARRTLACLGLGASLCWTGTAAAYCRTTTCIPGEDCEFDSMGCALSGIPLEWKRPCVSFAVQQDASRLREIDFDRAHSLIEAAYANWLASSCDGKLPSLDIADLGGVSCGEPQYNQGGPNANVWMFRDDRWESGGGASSGGVELAITIITFHPDTGEIYDADVEINSNQIPLTTGDQNIQYDLASIVTHEAGHFLGLSHSRVLDATMRENYVAGTTSLRHLSADDEAGMCAMYPPDREVPAGNCTPRHGFTSACYRAESGGCSVASAVVGGPSLVSPWAFALAGLLVGGGWTRRRVPSRSPRSPRRG